MPELHVNQAMFAGMHRAALKAAMDNRDSGLAAWEFTGLPLPPLPTGDIPIKVCLPDYGNGDAKLVE